MLKKQTLRCNTVCNELKDDKYIFQTYMQLLCQVDKQYQKYFHHGSIGVKLHMCYAYCCTMYCSQLWANFNKGTYLKAKVVYNNLYT